MSAFRPGECLIGRALVNIGRLLAGVARQKGRSQQRRQFRRRTRQYSYDPLSTMSLFPGMGEGSLLAPLATIHHNGCHQGAI